MGELVALLYLQPMASGGAAAAAAALLSLTKPTSIDSGQKQRFPLRIPSFYSQFSSRSISIEITRNSRRESNAERGRSQNFKFNFTDRNKRYKDNDAIEEDSGGEGTGRKRRWWSDKPPSMEEEEREPNIWEDFIDSLWILKLAKFYGWTLPPMIISALIATGPKAFLMAFALPMGQSVISFAWKLMGRARGKSTQKARNGRKPFVSNPGNVGVNDKQGRSQETVKGNGVPLSKVVDDYSDGSAKNGKQAFGGWDVLDGAEPRPLRKADQSGRKASTSVELGKSRGASDAPLLLRLLIAVFPFLASWTKML